MFKINFYFEALELSQCINISRFFVFIKRIFSQKYWIVSQNSLLPPPGIYQPEYWASLIEL